MPPDREAPAVASKDHALVQGRGLAMTFPGGIEALASVDFSLVPGEFVSIVGPSGCGKSTLLRLVAGLIEPTGGTVTVEGESPRVARRRGTETGFVFQQPALLPWRTVRGNIRLPLELRRERGAPADARVEEMIELVGLEEFARAHPRQLSGGMRMRVSLARALVTRPRLLLMDEPFGALDEITRQRLNEELLRLWQHEQCTVLFVTHNVYEAAFLSQRVLVMGRRPGSIAARLPVPFDYPRAAKLRAQPRFAEFAGEVSTALEEASR